MKKRHVSYFVKNKKELKDEDLRLALENGTTVSLELRDGEDVLHIFIKQMELVYPAKWKITGFSRDYFVTGHFSTVTQEGCFKVSTLCVS